jgi:hypothetical protein
MTGFWLHYIDEGYEIRWREMVSTSKERDEEVEWDLDDELNAIHPISTSI